ncbi:MAG: zinc ribbon domain-containing protein [Thermoguttaceae bacterium]|nr:zinc ribbon domain-containing protein [Thermoguttaceae bacterium]
MPTYEYHCEGCGQNVEIFHSMTAKPAEVCPNCGAKKLRRLISGGTGIIFKGHGFYCTDYKSSEGSSSASSASLESKSSENKASESSAKKSESKDSTSKAKGSEKKSSSSAKTEK